MPLEVPYKKLFPDTVLGLSDHTSGHSTVLGAIPLGARVFEKHFTDDNNREGPDHKFAMNPNTWREMVDRANEVYQSLGSGLKVIEENEKETAIVQRRGLWYVHDLTVGHSLKSEDFIALRPLNVDGIFPFEKDTLIGKKLKRNVKADAHVSWKDIE